MIDAVTQRLVGAVPALEHRVEGAADLADLMARNALPQQTPAAYVIPLGLTGRQEDASSGAYLQNFEEAVAVILTVRNRTPAGKRALANLRELIMSIVNALAGWAPSGQLGVFRLVRGSLVTASTGTVVYQIDFSIPDQLRILS